MNAATTTTTTKSTAKSNTLQLEDELDSILKLGDEVPVDDNADDELGVDIVSARNETLRAVQLSVSHRLQANERRRDALVNF